MWTQCRLRGTRASGVNGAPSGLLRLLARGPAAGSLRDRSDWLKTD